MDQAEEAIYNNDLRDISDIVAQVTAELKGASMDAQLAGRIRR